MRALPLTLTVLAVLGAASGTVGANSLVDAVVRNGGDLVAATEEPRAGLEARLEEAAGPPGAFTGATADALVHLASTTLTRGLGDADFALQVLLDDGAYLACEPPALRGSGSWPVWAANAGTCAAGLPQRANDVLDR